MKERKEEKRRRGGWRGEIKSMYGSNSEASEEEEEDFIQNDWKRIEELEELCYFER